MQKYRVFRGVARTAIILGWFFSILGVLWCVSGAIFMYTVTHRGEHVFKAAASGVMVGVGGLMLLAIGAIAKIAIDIERNTRITNSTPPLSRDRP
jgi:hypothetical protein